MEDRPIFVVSDIHLGAANCLADKFCEFLKTEVKGKASKLIINGDLFDSMDFKRLSKKHWAVLSNLRKLSDELELVWCFGNHDLEGESISHTIGSSFVESYTFVSGGRKFHCIHSDIYDEFIGKHPFLTKLADYIYRFSQYVDKSHSIARFLKLNSKAFMHNCQRIERKCLELGKRDEYDMVIASHTHFPCLKSDLGYGNTGSWTDRIGHYIVVDNGVAELKHYI